jgi:hypothetical protein
MKTANSEMNISRRVHGVGTKINELNGNGMKASSSAFELLNNSHENLVEETKSEKKKPAKVNRPGTFV